VERPRAPQERWLPVARFHECRRLVTAEHRPPFRQTRDPPRERRALVSAHIPRCFYSVSDFPTDGMELTHILVVAALAWYEDILGRPCIGSTEAIRRSCSSLGNWLLLVSGAGPTEDKPNVTMAAPQDSNVVDHSFTIRVPDCRQACEALLARGATFLTPPHQRGHEVRCFFRDPDGHLFEISQFG
jgi:catechol 2,3-dioxygenase-like lactoylglutathione lyase family enzyme